MSYIKVIPNLKIGTLFWKLYKDALYAPVSEQLACIHTYVQKIYQTFYIVRIKNTFFITVRIAYDYITYEFAYKLDVSTSSLLLKLYFRRYITLFTVI